MSWKLIFNAMLGSWMYITAGAKAAKEAGYSYFYWNGRVYEVEGKDTGLTDKDLY